MRVVLEVQSGPAAGKKTWLRPGQRVAIGRTEASDCVSPHDGHISSRHFALECDSHACLVRDLGSSNGTFLNGQKVSEAVVQNGDQIVAGQTTFRVQIEKSTALGPHLNSGTTFVAPARSAPHLQPSPLTTVNRPLAPLPQKGATAVSPRTILTIPQPYDAGIKDEDPAVRREALFAAAWTRQPWLLEYCRAQSQTPSAENWDAILLLAILGTTQDLSRILHLGKLAALGPTRFQALAALGHFEVLPILLESLRGSDLEAAIAAGEAFTKITGIEIGSEMPIPPEVYQAWEAWKKSRLNCASGTRWRRGLNVSDDAAKGALDQLDLESRWETCLRGKFEGTWSGRLMDLEAFPQRLRLLSGRNELQ